MLSITLGIFTRDASDRLCYEVYTLDSSMYMIVSYMIVEHFYLTSTDHLVDGFDGLFRDWWLGDIRIGLDWDIWSGFIVVAKESTSEALVRGIGEWLEQQRGRIVALPKECKAITEIQ